MFERQHHREGVCIAAHMYMQCQPKIFVSAAHGTHPNIDLLHALPAVESVHQHLCCAHHSLGTSQQDSCLLYQLAAIDSQRGLRLLIDTILCRV